VWIRCIRLARAVGSLVVRGGIRALAGASQALAAAGLFALAASLVLALLHESLYLHVTHAFDLNARGGWLVTGAGLLGLTVGGALAVGGVAAASQSVGRTRTRWTVAVVTWAVVLTQVPWGHVEAVGRAVHAGRRPSIQQVEAILPAGAFPLPVLVGRSVVWPIAHDARVSSGFGWRRHPILLHERFHNGVDIAVAEGTPVLAAADGVVDRASDDPLNGNHVVLLHDDGLRTAYCHLRDLHTQTGERVRAGERIGLSGMTGRATGPHLHFGVWVHGRAVDPLRLPRVVAQR